MKDYVITNCTIVRPDSLLENHSVEVRDSLIYKTGCMSDLSSSDLPVIDGQGGYLTPGFVEMHIHGCSTYCTGQKNDHVISAMKSFLHSKGINTFLPTMPYDPETLHRTVKELDNISYNTCDIPGVYVEGPFINKEKKGGIQEHNITEGDPELLQKIIRDSGNKLAMMTLAPETRHFDRLRSILNRNSIICALGHSACDLSALSLPEKTNNMNITHLFNAMSPVSHKNPGLAALPFIDENIFFELNTDGIHIDQIILDMSFRHLNLSRAILISDGVISAGSKPGEYDYMSEPVISDRTGVRKKENGILVGSNCLTDIQVKKLIQSKKLPLPVIIRMVTLNPLELLGLSESKGSVEDGKIADLVLWDRDFNLIKNLY